MVPDHKGNIISNPDADGNGRVTMNEAFNYAMTHDRRSDEHPQYSSTPYSVGMDLAFNNYNVTPPVSPDLPAIDLYIKDNEEDTGIEPNTTTDKFWASPSVWVRNDPDSIEQHESPVYTSNHHFAYVYVRVHNRGTEDYTRGKYMHVYWALASTGFTEKVWKGRELYNDEDPTGGHIGGSGTRIPPLKAGESTLVEVDWELPGLLKNFNNGEHHFCLAAKIMDTSFDDGYEEGKTYFDFKGSNDMASKNLIIIKSDDIYKTFNVYIRNTTETAANYSLELVPLAQSDEIAYDEANIELTMSPAIYNAWEAGGCQSTDVAMYSTYSNSNSSTPETTFKMLSPLSKLENIALTAGEFDVVKLKFDFFEYSDEEKTYMFDLIQRDQNGNIVGGERFLVEPPRFSASPVEIVPEEIGGGNVTLSAEGAEFNSYTWRNDRKQVIGTGPTVTVTPTVDNNTFNVTAMTDDGKVATNSISLTSVAGIKNISASNGNITVEFNCAATGNSTVSVKSLAAASTGLSVGVSAGAESVTLDASALSGGLYVVSYSVDGKTVDRKKITL